MFHHTKANYVKPQAKASYIRPLNGCYENNLLKDFSNEEKKNKQYDVLKSAKNPDLMMTPLSSVATLGESKDKHLKNLSLAHTNLFGEIEQIQTWKTSIELECSNKSKKLDELGQTTESQRKIILDLKIKNENLNLELKEEIQKRVYVVEKFYFTKELCALLKQKIYEIQSQFENCKKIKEAVDIGNEQQLKVIKDITMKFNYMSIECSEKLSHLHDLLMNEKKNSLILKDLCTEQSMNAEKEHRSYCDLIEKYQEEIKQFSKELVLETNNNKYLQQENDESKTRIIQLENTNVESSRKLNEAEKQLQLLGTGKLEMEKNYKLEVEKNNELNVKYEELSNTLNKQKAEIVEEISVLKETLNMLENCVSDQKLKISNMESKNKDLASTLWKVENDKKCLEDLLEQSKAENTKSNEKILSDSRSYEISINQLMEEKNNLNKSLEEREDELRNAIADNQKLRMHCKEIENKFFETSKEYESAILKTEELKLKCEKSCEYSDKIEELEYELRMKSELIVSKDEEINDLKENEKKYLEVEGKIKNLEESLQSKQELLFMKELKLEELKNVQERCAWASSKIKELENNILEKNQIIDDKQKMIVNLEADLRHKEVAHEKLEYENLEIKDYIEKEKNSAKICLECEILKDKVQEFEATLVATQEKLKSKSNEAAQTLKIMGEIEDNFDDMSIRKEKEIIKLKETVKHLQQDLMITKVHAAKVENLLAENEQLKNTLEKMTIQCQDDTFESKAKKDAFNSYTENEKPNNVCHMHENNRMEADSSHDVKKNMELTANNHKKIRTGITKKSETPRTRIPTIPEEKSKRMWESESSGSDCVQIVYHKEGNKMGFVHKREAGPLKRMPATSITVGIENLTQDGSVVGSENRKSKAINNFNLKPQERKEKALRDVVSSNTTKINPCNSPFIKRKMIINKDTPNTPAQKKFFKTPLCERYGSQKKPEPSNIWF